MKAVAQIVVALVPAILAGVLPFYRVLQGSRIWKAFALAWASLIAWTVVFCFVIPGVAFWLDRDLGREVATHWVPEGPAVITIIFFGWFYAGITVLLAMLVRRFRCLREKKVQANDT